MILQTLKSYYDRLASDPDCDIPRFGYSREKISWVVVIDQKGHLVLPILDFRRTLIDEKKKKERKIPREMNVPTTTATSSRSGTDPSPNFMWDNSAFVLGAKKIPGDSKKYFNKFKELHYQIGSNLNDEGMHAVLRFLDKWYFENIEDIENWNEIVSGNGNLVFRLDGNRELIHNRPKIQDKWEQYIKTEEERIASTKKGKNLKGICLITGKNQKIARIHRQIKGIKEPNGLRDAQGTGGSLIGFQDAKTAFCSFGMDHLQSYNSPVGIAAAFTYTTALNWLLRAESNQKIQIADATTVFWAERSSLMEQSFHNIFNPPREIESKEAVDDRETAQHIQVYLDAIRQGKLAVFEDEKDVKFYILGLSPNAARISIRFWHVSTIADIVMKIACHFRDIAIEKQYANETEYPGMWQLLRDTAVQKDSKNISPILGGMLIRSIITGSRYPESMLSAIIIRIRADQEVNYYRMSLIKGCLVRNYHKEVPEMLDKTKNDVSYLLGRLFAILERAQEDASGGSLNATIKDRYFSAASATPRSVFPLLLRLNQHHTSKGEHGGYYHKLIGEIMEALPADKLPMHMKLEDQGLFAIGYYHQRNALFRKQDKTEKNIVTHNAE